MDTDLIKKHLEDSKTIAVVGFSNNPSKAAHTVPVYLTKFYNVIPVNPNHSQVANIKSFTNLEEMDNSGIKADIINVFRPSEDCFDVTNQIVQLKNSPKLIWLQLNIRNEEARLLAKDNDIDFIQDKCIYVVHKELMN